MNQKQKEETTEVFAEAFHEVVVPVLEDLATKADVKKLEERLGGVEERLDNLDNKVEMINRRLITVGDHQAERIDNHETRNRKIEGTINN